MHKWIVIFLAPSCLIGGCSVLSPEPAGQILEQAEPISGDEYVLYKPSHYRSEGRWTLLVLCHSSPWQSPKSVIHDWSDHAEKEDLLLLAPKLSSTRDWAPGAEDQVRLQQQDEEHILACVHHVQGSCPVAEDRILIAGEAAGARGALFTGLRNPDVFRIVALVRPRFDAQHVGLVSDLIDPYQQVLVVVGMGDLAKDQSQELLDYLRGADIAVHEETTGVRPSRQREMVVQFVKRALRKEPWIRVQAYEIVGTTVRFRTHTSFEEVYKYEWDFGDGSPTSAVAKPEHLYARPGEYVVTLKIQPDRKETYLRRIRIDVQ